MAQECLPDVLRDAVAVGVIPGGLGYAPDSGYIGVPRFADLDPARGACVFAHASGLTLLATVLEGGLTALLTVVRIATGQTHDAYEHLEGHPVVLVRPGDAAVVNPLQSREKEDARRRASGGELDCEGVGRFGCVRREAIGLSAARRAASRMRPWAAFGERHQAV